MLTAWILQRYSNHRRSWKAGGVWDWFQARWSNLSLLYSPYNVPETHLSNPVGTEFLYLLLTYLLTYSMVQSPSWEANWFAASQEIPRMLWNPKVHYRTHKRPPPVPILCQPNPVHIPTSHLLEIQPNTIQPSTPRSPQWSGDVNLKLSRIYYTYSYATSNSHMLT